jgi:hypothetical protein
MGMGCNQPEIKACDDIHHGSMRFLWRIYGKTLAVKITQAAKMPPLFCQNPVDLALPSIHTKVLWQGVETAGSTFSTTRRDNDARELLSIYLN